GVGFILVRVDKKSKARFTVRMPDYASFSTKRNLPRSSAGNLPQFPVEKAYDKSASSIKGNASATRTPTQADRIFGRLKWVKPPFSDLIAQLDGNAYKAGPNDFQQWFNPANNPNAIVRLSRGGLQAPLEVNGYVNNGKMSVNTSELDLSLNFNATGGTFKGSMALKSGQIANVLGTENLKVSGGLASDLGFLLSQEDKLQPRARGS